MRHMVGISGKMVISSCSRSSRPVSASNRLRRKVFAFPPSPARTKQLPCNERGVHDNEQAVVRTDAFEDILSGLARLQEGILTVHNALGLSRASRRERDGAEHVRSWPAGGIVDSLLLRNEGIEAVGVRRAVGQRHAHN